MNGFSTPPSTPDDRLLLVQVLRGVAALLVLVGHTQGLLIEAAAQQGTALARWPLPPGGFGVDLFFCISGFIMVVASRSLYGQPGAAGAFLRRRALRLVPLYWLATGLFALMLLLGRHGLERISWNDLFASLLFVPYPVFGDAAQPYPLLSLGWSLNYEVLFYALFAVFIALPPRRAVCCTMVSLLGVVLLGCFVSQQFIALHFWSRPILLEFGLGCAIGLWCLGRTPISKKRPAAPSPFDPQRVNAAPPDAAVLSTIGVLACAGAAVVALALDPLGLAAKPTGGSTPNDLVRVIGWGLPAAALLITSVALEHRSRSLGGVLPCLGRLGDWSYSLYLMHPFAVMATIKVWQRFELHHVLPWWVLGGLLIVNSLLVAAVCYRFVEQPLLRLLRPAVSPRRVRAIA